MLCPFCGYESSKVLESRSTAEKSSIRRRRECESCQRRFTTYEKIELIPLLVIKKSGSREEYSREKLLDSVMLAVKKCNISIEIIEEIIDSVEFELSISGKREISTNYIGEKILESLINLNEVAYIRYLSVFRRIRTIDELKIEVDRMTNQLSLI